MIARALSATEVIRTENHHSPQSAAA